MKTGTLRALSLALTGVPAVAALVVVFRCGMGAAVRGWWAIVLMVSLVEAGAWSKTVTSKVLQLLPLRILLLGVFIYVPEEARGNGGASVLGIADIVLAGHCGRGGYRAEADGLGWLGLPRYGMGERARG